MTHPTLTPRQLAALITALSAGLSQVLRDGAGHDTETASVEDYRRWVFSLGLWVGRLQNAGPYLAALGYRVPDGPFPFDGELRERLSYLLAWQGALAALVRYVDQPTVPTSRRLDQPQ